MGNPIKKLPHFSNQLQMRGLQTNIRVGYTTAMNAVLLQPALPLHSKGEEYVTRKENNNPGKSHSNSEKTWYNYNI